MLIFGYFHWFLFANTDETFYWFGCWSFWQDFHFDCNFDVFTNFLFLFHWFICWWHFHWLKILVLFHWLRCWFIWHFHWFNNTKNADSNIFMSWNSISVTLQIRIVLLMIPLIFLLYLWIRTTWKVIPVSLSWNQSSSVVVPMIF